MLLILCFLYCFFAIVLGLYLGLELISIRKADRVARTILKAAAQSTRADAAPILPESATPSTEPNYFTVK